MSQVCVTQIILSIGNELDLCHSDYANTWICNIGKSLKGIIPCLL